MRNQFMSIKMLSSLVFSSFFQQFAARYVYFVRKIIFQLLSKTNEIRCSLNFVPLPLPV